MAQTSMMFDASDFANDEFVMVSKEDAIEGMAYYIALYLSRTPEAQKMDPKQLQQALTMAFQVCIVWLPPACSIVLG